VLDAVSTGGRLELGEHASKLRLEAPCFGGSELVGNDEVGKADECLTDALETLLELGGGGGGHGARCGLGPDKTEGRMEKLAPVGLVGDAVGGEEHESLAELEAVALHGGDNGVLVFAGQGAQGVGQRGA